MLSDKGVKRGLTKEKIEGTYKRPADLTEENTSIWIMDYFVETTKIFFNERPDLFDLDSTLRDRIFDFLKG